MKTNAIAILLLSFSFLSSCTDLTEKVYSDIPMNEFFQNEQELLMNAGRAYSKLQGFPREQGLWSLLTMTSDEGVIVKLEDGSWWDNGRWDELQTHNFSSSNKINRLAWEYIFGGITACNEVLYETAQSALEFDGKYKILAEIKVLRALFYYWAMDGWGNVPFTVDFADKNLPVQKDRAFLFDFIEKEVQENLPYLDEVPEASNYGRVTKSMAYTLLAKLYLNAGEWTGTARWKEAENYCDSVIRQNRFTIEANYFDNFKINNEGSRENIFVIVYSSLLTTDNFYWFDLTLAPESVATYKLNDTPWNGFITSPEFFQSYDEKDLRRHAWLFGQQYDASGNKLYELHSGDTSWFKYEPIFPEAKYKTGRHKWDGARCCKYEFQTDGLQLYSREMDNDFVFFRYADVVLMKVEAMMHQGRTAEAVQLTDFQNIRTRAGLLPYTAEELTEEELLAERGRELAWEGHRRQDLIRFGKWTGKWWAKGITPASRKLFQIPQTALDANPNLKQNS